MKITKITISVFFLAFLIGYVSVPQKKEVLLETPVIVQTSLLVKPTGTKVDLETI